MEGKRAAELLERIADILEFLGENPFKVRAYRKAAHFIEGVDNLEEYVYSGRLSKVKGIGPAIEGKVKEFLETGRISYLEELEKKVPKEVFELFEVPGLGPKRVRVLYEKLGIKSISELEYACNENRLITLPGFGEKTQRKILKGIELLKKKRENQLLSEALEASRVIIEEAERKGVLIHETGELRRRIEVVGGLSFVSKGEVEEFLKSISRELRKDNGVWRGYLREFGYPFRVYQGDEDFFKVLFETTGSKGHVEKVKGLFKRKFGGFKGEKEIYEKVGLPFIPPELREDMGEVEAALEGKLPDLITEKDLGGIIHVHTVYSDGRNTIEELASEVMKMGYRYIGISDHSKSAHYAGGLKEEDIRRQHQEIDRLNEVFSSKGFRIFKGIESDILPDGSLDYDDKVLDSFDFVIASVHSHFGMSKAEMTKRIIKAMSHPKTTIIGHPTGRLLLGREGYEVDMEELLHAAKEYGKVLEINANPMRLDLDWRWLVKAKRLGIKVVIGPDAHNISGLYDIRYGVMVARKGWIEKRDLFFLDEGKGS